MTTFKNTIILFILGMLYPFMALHAQTTIDKPDNIIEDVDCFTIPPATKWDMERKHVSNAYVHSLATPFVGDLDGDGRVEVVAPSGENFNTSANILVFDDRLQLKHTITPPSPMPNYSTTTLLIADVDNDRKGEIVVACQDGLLRCYTHDGAFLGNPNTPKWTSSAAYPYLSPSPVSQCVSLIVADIDGDGNAEILAGNNIYAAESGNFLVALPAGGRGYANGHSQSYMPVFADINNDGIQEVVAGNTVYQVVITDRATPTGNTATILAQISMPDGFTAVADIDGDGTLDVIVTGRNLPVSNEACMYVWDGAAAAQIGNTVTIPSNLGRISRPFAGDITSNGRPNIAFTYTNKIEAYEYDSKTNQFNNLWSKPTTDASGATTMSMFDFNQDGEVELVYRDETQLRIIGKDGENKTAFRCYSATHTEYPVIVDLDRDGHADILVSGSETVPSPGPNQVRLYSYGSITPGQWAPARSVWNQHAYNATNINADLSVPRNPDPLAVFDGPDGNPGGGDDVRPFNNFLQQQTLLNRNGTPLWLAPNAEYVNDPVYDYYPDGDSLRITIDVQNSGDAPFYVPFYISVYKKGGTETLVKTDSIMQVIPIGSTAQKVISIKNLSNYQPFDSLVIQLNDKNQGKYEQLECNTTGNRRGEIRRKIVRAHPDLATVQKYYSVEILELPNDSLPASPPAVSISVPAKAGVLNVVGNKLVYTNTGGPLTENIDSFRYQVTLYNPEVLADRTYAAWVYVYVLEDLNGAAACSGQAYKVELLSKPAGTTFSWYDSGGGGTPSVGNTRTVTNTTDVTFQIQPDVTIPRYALLGGFPKGVFTIKMANPGGITPTMRWTGQADSLWQNPANWVVLKSDASGKPYEAPASHAPTTCVNVIIPSNVDYFPELVDSAYCADILMKDRAMLKNPHVLVYRNASVEIKLKPAERDRFVMWSAPLRNMYSGDYHYRVNGAVRPQGDAFMTLFQQANPDHTPGSTAAKNYFTATIGSVNQPLDLGRAFNLKVVQNSITNDSLLRFPSPADSYNGVNLPSRSDKNKFITHGQNLDASGQFDLPVTGGEADNKLVQVVNPYMAYLSMGQFLANNNHAIQNGYYFWNGEISTGFNILTTMNNGNRIEVAGNPLTSYLGSATDAWIAPLQSFFVAKTNEAVPRTTLKMSPDWTTTSPVSSYSLRASKKTVSNGGVLHITLSQGEKKAYAALLYNPSASNFTDPEDMPAIIYDELPLAVYTFSMNEALAINSSSTFDMFNVPIGFRATTAGETKLEFTNQETFGYDVVLIDNVLNKRIDLSATPEYTFTVTKTNSAPVEINDRFSLEMKYTGNGVTITGNEAATQPTTLQVSAGAGYIYIKSESGVIGRLQVYDTVGRLVYGTANLNESQFKLPVNSKQMYIVKATIGEETVVEKIMAN
ncbi:hypothetical protein FACS189438_1060 [Bacteroidia bacterium]|nr:hypothetical protein FACS189438_1060 [Bacteroidia bacterium]